MPVCEDRQGMLQLLCLPRKSGRELRMGIRICPAGGCLWPPWRLIPRRLRWVCDIVLFQSSSARMMAAVVDC